MESYNVVLSTVLPVLAVVAFLAPPIRLLDRLWNTIIGYSFEVASKHCYITGGSSGLGRSLAILLAGRGANITIVARNEAKLKEAAEEIQKHCVSDNQKVVFVSADCADKQQAKAALEKAVTMHDGKIPEHLFLCAGLSLPGIFVEQDISQYERNMNINYFGSLYTAHECVRLMVDNGVQGSVTFVSSLLGLFGLIGYSQYVPTKYAVRGLAEALRSELQAYGISVHCYFPATILTPGFDEENLTKPAITREIEGTDEGQSPEVCARKLLSGLERGEFAIASDSLGWIFRCCSRGAAPMNNVLTDTIIAAIGWIALPCWRLYADALVKKWARANAKVKSQ